MKKGHRKIAYVGDNLSSAKQRCFCNAMKKYALPISEEHIIIEEHRYETGGYRAMEKILELNNKPTALFVAYDYMAIGVYKCIREHNLSVPQDFSIIGMENINTKDYLDTPLTSIYGRSREKCESAVALLLKKMENKRYREPKKTFESTLIPRTSVADIEGGK
jgi:DNA-binding LacI/PurR family transcriptional regulator